MRKKLISFLLAVVMLVGLLPASALAADNVPDSPAFFAQKTCGDVEVTVTAPAGVFPEGAKLKVTALSEQDEDAAAIAEAMDEVRAINRTLLDSYTFDISVLNAEGEEIQPKTRFGNAEVSFRMAGAKNHYVEAEVYHMSEKFLRGMVAEPLDATTAHGEVSVETKSFSCFVVDLSYLTKEYRFSNMEEIPLDAVLTTVGFGTQGSGGYLEAPELEGFPYSTDESVFTVTYPSEEYAEKYGDEPELVLAPVGRGSAKLVVEIADDEGAVQQYEITVYVGEKDDRQIGKKPVVPEEFKGIKSVRLNPSDKVNADLKLNIPEESYAEAMHIDDVVYPWEKPNGYGYTEVDESSEEYQNWDFFMDFVYEPMTDQAQFRYNGKDVWYLGGGSPKAAGGCLGGIFTSDLYPTGVEGLQMIPFAALVPVDTDDNPVLDVEVMLWDGRGCNGGEMGCGGSGGGIVNVRNAFVDERDPEDLPDPSRSLYYPRSETKMQFVYGYAFVDGDYDYGYQIIDHTNTFSYTYNDVFVDAAYNNYLKVGDSVALADLVEIACSGDIADFRTVFFEGDYYNETVCPDVFYAEEPGEYDVYCRVYDQFDTCQGYTNFNIIVSSSEGEAADDAQMGYVCLAGGIVGMMGTNILADSVEHAQAGQDLIDTMMASSGADLEKEMEEMFGPIAKEVPYIRLLAASPTLLDDLKNYFYTIPMDEYGYPDEDRMGDLQKVDPQYVELADDGGYSYPLDLQALMEDGALIDDEYLIVTYEITDPVTEQTTEVPLMLMVTYTMEAVMLDMDFGFYGDDDNEYGGGSAQIQKMPVELPMGGNPYFQEYYQVAKGDTNFWLNQLVEMLSGTYDLDKHANGREFYISAEIDYLKLMYPEFPLSLQHDVWDLEGEYVDGEAVYDKNYTAQDLPFVLSGNLDVNTVGVYFVELIPLIDGVANEELTIRYKVEVVEEPEKKLDIKVDKEALVDYLPEVRDAKAEAEFSDFVLDNVTAQIENTLIDGSSEPAYADATFTVTDPEGAEVKYADMREGVEYTVTYYAQHPKDATVNKTATCTLNFYPTDLTFKFPEGDDGLEIGVGLVLDGNSALLSGVFAEDTAAAADDPVRTIKVEGKNVTLVETDLDVNTVGTYTATYRATHPKTGKVYEATRTIEVKEKLTNVPTVELKVPLPEGIATPDDILGTSYLPGNDPAKFSVGATGQNFLIFGVAFNCPEDQKAEYTLKIYAPKGFRFVAVGQDTTLHLFESVRTDDVVTIKISDRTNVVKTTFEVMPNVEQLYPELENGVNSYTFTTELTKADGTPVGDCSKGTLTLSENIAFDDAVTVTAGKQSFTPKQMFGADMADPDEGTGERTDKIPYQIVINKAEGKLLNYDWMLDFTLPAALDEMRLDYRFYDKDNKEIYGARNGSASADNNYHIRPYNTNDVLRTSNPTKLDSSVSYPYTYMDALRKATKIVVEAYFDSTPTKTPWVINLPGASAAQTMDGSKVTLTSGEKTVVSDDPISICLTNPSAGAGDADNTALTLTTYHGSAAYGGTASTDNPSDVSLAGGDKTEFAALLSLSNMSTWEAQKEWNLYQGLEVTSTFDPLYSPVSFTVDRQYPDSSREQFIEVTYVVKNAAGAATNKQFKTIFLSSENAFEVNSEAGEYVASVTVKYPDTINQCWDSNSSGEEKIFGRTLYHSVDFPVFSIVTKPVTEKKELTVTTTVKDKNHTNLLTASQQVTLNTIENALRVAAHDNSNGFVIPVAPGNYMGDKQNKGCGVAVDFTMNSQTQTYDKKILILTGDAVQTLDTAALGDTLVGYSVSDQITTAGPWNADEAAYWVQSKTQIQRGQSTGFKGLTLTGVLIDLSGYTFAAAGSTELATDKISFASKDIWEFQDLLAKKYDSETEAAVLTFSVGFHVEGSNTTFNMGATEGKTQAAIVGFQTASMTQESSSTDTVKPFSNTGSANESDFSVGEMDLFRVAFDKDKLASYEYGAQRNAKTVFTGDDLLSLVEGVYIRDIPVDEPEDHIVKSVEYETNMTAGEPKVVSGDGLQTGDYRYGKGTYEDPYRYRDTVDNSTYVTYAPFALEKGEYVTKITVYWNDRAHRTEYADVGLVRTSQMLTKSPATGKVFSAATTLPVHVEMTYDTWKDESKTVTLDGISKKLGEPVDKMMRMLTNSVSYPDKIMQGNSFTIELSNAFFFTKDSFRLGRPYTDYKCYVENGNIGKSNDKLQHTVYYRIDPMFEYAGQYTYTESDMDAKITYKASFFENGDGLLKVAYVDKTASGSDWLKLTFIASYGVPAGVDIVPIKEVYFDATEGYAYDEERGYAISLAPDFTFVTNEQKTELGCGEKCIVNTIDTAVKPNQNGATAVIIRPTITQNDVVTKGEQNKTLLGNSPATFGLDAQIVTTAATQNEDWEIFVALPQAGATAKTAADKTSDPSDFTAKLAKASLTGMEGTTYTMTYYKDALTEITPDKLNIVAQVTENLSEATVVKVTFTSLEPGVIPKLDLEFAEVEKDKVGDLSSTIVAYYKRGADGAVNYVSGELTLTDYVITGTVWNDANFNGIKDADEIGIAGVPVSITHEDETPVMGYDESSESVMTDASGVYTLRVPYEGKYVLNVAKIGVYDMATQNATDDPAARSWANPMTGDVMIELEKNADGDVTACVNNEELALVGITAKNINVGLVETTINANDFYYGISDGALNAATFIKLADAYSVDRNGIGKTLTVDEEELAAINAKISAGKTAKLPLTVSYTTEGGVKVEKTVSAYLRKNSSANPATADLYMTANDIAVNTNATLTKSTAKKMAFVNVLLADGSLLNDIAKIKVDNDQLAAINAAIAAFDPENPDQNKYNLKFTYDTATVTIKVTLTDGNAKKGKPGETPFFTASGFTYDMSKGAINASDSEPDNFLTLAKVSGFDKDGYPIPFSGLTVTGIDSINQKIDQRKPGTYRVKVCKTLTQEDIDAGITEPYPVLSITVKVVDHFQLVYDGNGATGGSMTADTVEYNSVKTLRKNTFVRDEKSGYTFAGWATTPTGSAVYTDEFELTEATVNKLYQNAKDPDGDGTYTYTLYAVWNRIPGTASVNVTVTPPASQKGYSSVLLTIKDSMGLEAADSIAETMAAGTNLTAAFTALDPDTYTVKLTAGSYTETKTVSVEKGQTQNIDFAVPDQQPLTVKFVVDDVEVDSCDWFTNKSYDLPVTTKEGYILTGWTDENGTPDDRSDDTFYPIDKPFIFSGEGEAVTLVPNWRSEKYTVEFETDGGSEISAQGWKYGNSYELPGTTKPNYTLKGWKTEDGTLYATDAKLKDLCPGLEETESATLMAVWKEETVFITFDPNGGSVVRTTKELGKATAAKYGALPAAAHPYAEFDGWYTAAEGGTPVNEETTAEEVPFNGGITLYAHWKEFKTFEDSVISEDVTVTSPQQTPTYGEDFTFEPDDGKTEVTITIGGKDYYTAPKPDGSYTIPGKDITGDVVVNAKAPAADTVTLTYMFDGKVFYTTTVAADANYPTVNLPTKTGYDVDGWFTTAEPAEDEDTVEGEIGEGATTLYASATKKSITYTFPDGTTDTVPYGNPITFPADPTETGKEFMGWKASNGVFIPKSDTTYSYKMPDASEAGGLTFEPVWQQVGNLSITVKDTSGEPVPGAKVNLISHGVVVKTVEADENGAVVFSGLEYGAYNVSVVSNVDGTEKVTTVGQDITAGNTSLCVEIPTFRLNTVVEASDIEMNLTAQNLDNATTAKPAATGSQEVTITLKAVPTEDKNKTTIDTLVAKEAADDGKNVEMVDYVDLTVSKTTQNYNADGTAQGAPKTEPVTTTSAYQIISIELSGSLYKKLAEINGTMDNILVYRQHGNQAEKLKKVSEADGARASFECYWVKSVEGVDYIVVKARNFSTYAIGFMDEAVEVKVLPEEGSSYGETTYAITGPDTENGKLTISTRYAYEGQTVKITVTPDEGYKLDQLTIKDKDGKELEVKSLGDNKYSFVMPSGKVTVSATFVKAGTCPQDETCVYAKFTDADTKAWYHDGVHFCVERGYMIGMSDNVFAPNGTLTRAQIVTMLWRMEGNPVVDYAMTFKDVPADEWYTEAIRWAQSNKIVEGYSAEAFGPNDPITREQLTAILYRFAKNHKIDVTNSNTLAGFTDADKVSSWALDAMKWANAVGLVQGRTATTLVPDAEITRAEAATMIQRYCEKISDK